MESSLGWTSARTRSARSAHPRNRLSTPTSCERLLSAICQSLAADRLDSEHITAACEQIATLLCASRVHLLRDIPPPFAPHGTSHVHDVDRHTLESVTSARISNDGDHTLMGIVRTHGASVDALVAVRTDTAFGPGELAWMELLLVHVAAALDRADQLIRPLPTVAGAAHLTRLFPGPCVLVDADGKCVESNETFDHLLQVLPGSMRGGRLVFDRELLQAAWRGARAQATATGSRQTLSTTTESGECWTVHLVPFHCAGNAGANATGRLMLAMFERSISPDTHLPLATSEPLTKAEFEVLEDLLLGHTGKAIARRRGASVNTVRNQISTILSKTGHRTQKELMAAVGASAHGRIDAVGSVRTP